MTEETKRTRAYASLWIGSVIVEKLDGISGPMTDIVCTKAFTEIEAIRNFSAYYNHARRTEKTIVRVVQLFTFSEFTQNRMCYDINQMPKVSVAGVLPTKLKEEADRVAKMTCDQIRKELGIYHDNSPQADLPARPMAKTARQERSIGSMLEHNEPKAEEPAKRVRPRPAAEPSPAPKAVVRRTVKRARG